MDTLIEVFIVSLGVSYLLGAIDAFFNLGKLKGFVALLFATGFYYLIGYYWLDIVISAPASAFLSLAIMMLLERPNVIQTRRLP